MQFPVHYDTQGLPWTSRTMWKLRLVQSWVHMLSLFILWDGLSLLAEDECLHPALFQREEGQKGTPLYFLKNGMDIN